MNDTATTTYEWDSVCAGAYRGGRRSLTTTLYHLNNGVDDGSLCGRVQSGHMAGAYLEPNPPVADRCPRCTKKAGL